MWTPIDETLKYALFLARHLSHSDCSTAVILILYGLGITPKNNGFTYLKRAIVLYYENPTRQLKGDIYAQISEEFNGAVSEESIEQNIRRAVADAWKHRNEEYWSLFFPEMREKKIRKPSNGDFIAKLAWFVELWKGCCKEVLYAQ